MFYPIYQYMFLNMFYSYSKFMSFFNDYFSIFLQTRSWKKKFYSPDGNLEEELVAFQDKITKPDPRYTVQTDKDDSYSLKIQNFRSQDCGTYECEVKSRGRTAVSQVLLFTCL